MCRYLNDNHVVPDDADVADAAYVKLMLQSMVVDMKHFLLEVGSKKKRKRSENNCSIKEVGKGKKEAINHFCTELTRGQCSIKMRNVRLCQPQRLNFRQFSIFRFSWYQQPQCVECRIDTVMREIFQILVEFFCG